MSDHFFKLILYGFLIKQEIFKNYPFIEKIRAKKLQDKAEENKKKEGIQ